MSKFYMESDNDNSLLDIKSVMDDDYDSEEEIFEIECKVD